MKPFSNYRLLLAEDDNDLRGLIKEDFEEFGAKVIAVSNGQEAWSQLQVHDFDFIISDMKMPCGDGVFLAEKINLIKQKKPVLFVYTGYNSTDKNQLKALGIAEVFLKPCSVSEILERILKHLKK